MEISNLTPKIWIIYSENFPYDPYEYIGLFKCYKHKHVVVELLYANQLWHYACNKQKYSLSLLEEDSSLYTLIYWGDKENEENDEYTTATITCLLNSKKTKEELAYTIYSKNLYKVEELHYYKNSVQSLSHFLSSGQFAPGHTTKINET